MAQKLKKIAKELKSLSIEELLAVLQDTFSEISPYEDEKDYCESNYFIGIGYRESVSDTEGLIQ